MVGIAKTGRLVERGDSSRHERQQVQRLSYHADRAQFIRHSILIVQHDLHHRHVAIAGAGAQAGVDADVHVRVPDARVNGGWFAVQA